MGKSLGGGEVVFRKNKWSFEGLSEDFLRYDIHWCGLFPLLKIFTAERALLGKMFSYRNTASSKRTKHFLCHLCPVLGPWPLVKRLD